MVGRITGEAKLVVVYARGDEVEELHVSLSSMAT
jgi:hypothetical protein